MENKGHTLIELLVVLAIVAIIAAVAIPVFQGYAARSRIDELKANILKVASIQENYFASRGRFASSITALNAFEQLDSPEGIEFRTGMILRENSGMSYWVSGRRDVTNTGDTEECWVFFSSNLNPGTDDNFVRYYDQMGGVETHSECTQDFCPAYDGSGGACQ